MTNYYMDDSVLRHFGVKGMKWGVRKDKTRGLKARSQRASEQYVESVMFQRNRARNALNSGSARKAFLNGGLLGVAAVKSKRFNEVMNKRLDSADALDKQALSDLKAGKRNASTFIIKYATFNPVDLALVNVRDRNR